MGRLVIDAEGKIAKFVEAVDQISFSGKRATLQGRDVTYVTERCVFKLIDGNLTVTEIAPGMNLEQIFWHRRLQSLAVSDKLQLMDAALFSPEVMGLKLADDWAL